MPHAGEHVVFPYDQALALARAAWSVAVDIDTNTQPARAAAANVALEQWRGRFAQDFAQHMAVSNTDAANVAGSLQAMAKGLAVQWAIAEYQEQLDSYATLVQKKRDSQGFWDQVGNFFTGDQTNYGSPPGHPEVPAPPGFAPTAVPQAHVP